MLKKALLLLVAVVAVLVAVVATRPDQFRVERSARLVAPPAVVFALVNDFHRWSLWSPWEKLDPAMRRTFSGSVVGPGAIYEWTGNDKVGEGRMTIVSSRPGEQVDIKLEFLKPWPASNDCLFTFAPDGEGTRVTWSMVGRNNFMLKAMTMFMNMDSMVGKDFERGLALMKDVAETEARRQAEAARAAAAPTPPAEAPANAPAGTQATPAN